MPGILSPLDALAEELGAVAARIERELRARFDAMLAELRAEANAVRAVASEMELRAIKAERAHADIVAARVAEVRDGRDGVDGVAGKDGDRGIDGAPGRDGADGAAGKDGAPGMDGAPGRDGIDGAPGMDGADGAAGKDGEAGVPGRDGIDGAAGRDGVDGAPGRDGSDGVAGKDGDPGPPGRDGVDGAPGRDGIDGAAGKDGVDGKDGAVGERGADGAPGRDGVDGRDGEIGASGKDGEAGPAGRDGAPGKLPIVRAWTDGVHYEGDVVTLSGSTYQALRDTGRSPPHDDWSCLAAAGRAGSDGRSFNVCGTWSSEDVYSALDVVALNGAAFIARHDAPGACPGEGWQMIASQGKRGQTGEKGDRGDRGPAGPAVTRIEVDDDALMTITSGDGTRTTCDLYPLLIKLQS